MYTGRVCALPEDKCALTLFPDKNCAPATAAQSRLSQLDTIGAEALLLAFPDLRCGWRPRVAFLGFYVGVSAFLEIDVRVAGFRRFCVRVARIPRDRRPRGGVPRDLRSRGKNRHGDVNQGVKNLGNVNPMEHTPRQRQSHGKPATATSIPRNAPRSQTDSPLCGSIICCVVR